MYYAKQKAVWQCIETRLDWNPRKKITRSHDGSGYNKLNAVHGLNHQHFIEMNNLTIAKFFGLYASFYLSVWPDFRCSMCVTHAFDDIHNLFFVAWVMVFAIVDSLFNLIKSNPIWRNNDWYYPMFYSYRVWIHMELAIIC